MVRSTATRMCGDAVLGDGGEVSILDLISFDHDQDKGKLAYFSALAPGGVEGPGKE